MFETGDRIRFPDPLANDAMTDGTFLEIAVGEPVEVSSAIGSGPGRLADTAWVSRDDGTTARVVYERIRPA
jgi:hypothetical protein